MAESDGEMRKAGQRLQQREHPRIAKAERGDPLASEMKRLL